MFFENFYVYLNKNIIMKHFFKDPLFQTLDGVFESIGSIISPQTRTSKTDKNYHLSMSVPGLTKDDLDIVINDGLLTVSYDRSDKSLFVEGFKKSFKIPEDVNLDEIGATVMNGVLEVTLPITKVKSTERKVNIK
jgi:HSP20 family protein